MAVEARPASGSRSGGSSSHRGAQAARPKGGGGRTKAPGKKPSGHGAGSNRSGTGATPTGRTRPTRAAAAVGAGIVWGVLTLGALAVSPVLTAVVVAPVAAVATASGIRATETRTRPRSRTGGSRGRRRPSMVRLASVATAVVVPLVASAGSLVGLTALVLAGGGLVALVVASGYASSARPLRAVSVKLVAALGPAVAATCVVVADQQGTGLAAVFLAGALAYDAGAFVMGNGRTPLGGPVGVAFGILSVAVAAIYAAAVMNPPFSGNRPWVVFGLVALLAPAGVRLGQAVAGPERLPAVRRLDSLFLSAPTWVLVSALVLHR